MDTGAPRVGADVDRTAARIAIPRDANKSLQAARHKRAVSELVGLHAGMQQAQH